MSSDTDSAPTAPASPAAGIWAPAQRPLTVGLVLAVTFVAFEALAVATILPVVGRQLGDLRLYGWVFSAFLLASLIGIVLAGTLADRVPLGRPMLAGLVLFALGLIIGGTAPDMLVLVAGRAVQGLGAGVVPAVAYVAISRCYAEEARPRMFAVLSTAWVVPGLIGPGYRRPGGRGSWLALGIPGPAAAGDRGRGAGRAGLAARPATRESGNGRRAVPGRAWRGGRRRHGAGVAQFRRRARGRRGRCRRRRPSRCLHAPADTASVSDRTARADRHNPQPVAADVLLLRWRRLCPVCDRNRPARPDGAGSACADGVDPYLDGRIVGAGPLHSPVGAAPSGPAWPVPGRHRPRRDVRGAPAGGASRAGDRGLGVGRRGDRHCLRSAVGDHARSRRSGRGGPGDFGSSALRCTRSGHRHRSGGGHRGRRFPDRAPPWSRAGVLVRYRGRSDRGHLRRAASRQHTSGRCGRSRTSGRICGDKNR